MCVDSGKLFESFSITSLNRSTVDHQFDGEITSSLSSTQLVQRSDVIMR